MGPKLTIQSMSGLRSFRQRVVSLRVKSFRSRVRSFRLRVVIRLFDFYFRWDEVTLIKQRDMVSAG